MLSTLLARIQASPVAPFFLAFWVSLPFIYSEYFVDPYFDSKIFFSQILVALAAAGAMYENQNLFSFRCSGLWKLLFLILGALLLYLVFVLPSALHFVSEFFFWMVLWAYLVQVYRKERHRFWDSLSLAVNISFVVVATVSSFQWLYGLIDPEFAAARIDTGYFSLNFGNVNIYAQFLGLSFPFLHFQFFSRPSKKTFALLFWLLTLVGLSLCRSIILAVFVCGVCGWLYHRYKFRYLLLLATYVILVSSWGQPNFRPAGEQKIVSTVHSSMSSRTYLIQTGLEASLMHPWGIGVGGYAENTMAYRPRGSSLKKNERSPHNEFIRILVEWGWFGFLLAMILLGGVLWSYWKQTKNKCSVEDLLVWQLILILGLESLTQFPLEMSHPKLIGALCLAHISIKSFKFSKERFGRVGRWSVLLALSFFLAVSWIGTHNSSFWDHKLGGLSSWVCQAGIGKWERCLNYSRAIEEENPEMSRRIVRSLIYRSPYNIHLIGDYSLRQLDQGHQAEACLGFNIQRSLYRGVSHLPSQRFDKCQKWDAKTPLPEQIQRWLELSGLDYHFSYSAR